MPDREKARSFLEQQALDYRARAEQFRVVAEGTLNPKAKRVMLALAAEADRMAVRVEARVKALAPRPIEVSSSAVHPVAWPPRSS